jgi:hypothetical protein
MGSKGDIILHMFMVLLLHSLILLFSIGNLRYVLVQDPSESLAVIGRYISENYNGAALHPIDFIDISTGQLVAEVMDPNITTISPVNKLHPRDDVLATGSSRFALCSLINLMVLSNKAFFYVVMSLIIRSF